MSTARNERNEHMSMEQQVMTNVEMNLDHVDISHYTTECAPTPRRTELTIQTKEFDPSAVMQSSVLKFSGCRL